MLIGKWEEVGMKVRSQRRESASPCVDVPRRRVPHVAVARRIDSDRPTRVWSLLVPPSFLRPQGATADREAAEHEALEASAR
jgi:hypothetical protein